MSVYPSPYPIQMIVTVRDDTSGALGVPASTASYWVQEDGTSKWVIEEGGGFWITEESV